MNVFGWKGRAVMHLLQGEPRFASSLWLIDNLFPRQNQMECSGKEPVCEWVCRQLVAEILERGGMKWKSPLSRIHLLECVGRSRAEGGSFP